MLRLVRATWRRTRPGTTFSDCNAPRLPVASATELMALCDLAPPCCSHVALCDGSCRDAYKEPASRNEVPARDIG